MKWNGSKHLFILDASVVLSWFFEDEQDPIADQFLGLIKTELKDSLWVPYVWHFEILNRLYKGFLSIPEGETKPRMTEKEARGYMDIVDELDVDIDSNSSLKVRRHIRKLCDQHGLSCFDASYLSLAIMKNLPIGTLDKKLAKAAHINHLLHPFCEPILLKKSPPKILIAS